MKWIISRQRAKSRLPYWNRLRKHEKSTKHQLERPCYAWEDLWDTDTSIFETQAKASLVCWSFCQVAETRDPRAEADPIGIVIGIGDRWNNEPADHSLTPPPTPIPHLTCAKRVCPQELAARPAFLPYIIRQRNFLKKKFQWPYKYTKCRVSDFLTRYYSTDRGIIETALKTSFSRSHFSLFSPISIQQIPAFPRKEKIQERKRDDGVTNRRYKPRSPDQHLTDDLYF